MRDWKRINERIRECRQLIAPDRVIDCLLNLFQQTKDGWVAFNLAQEYEGIDKLEEALEYYQKAEALLPLPRYREKARDAINRVKSKLIERRAIQTPEEKFIEGLPNLSKLDPSNTLFVVSCTPDKIWDHDPIAPDFIPARYVYRGERFLKFLKWVEDNKIEKKNFFWVILSGKYGFIEPWHPISRYDVNLSDLNTYPVSDETLKNQANQKRWWRNNNGMLVEIKLVDFNDIICVNCSKTYLSKIGMCFPSAKVQNIDMGSVKL
jgi:tetratricopeptide (TPR) repeat protein